MGFEEKKLIILNGLAENGRLIGLFDFFKGCRPLSIEPIFKMRKETGLVMSRFPMDLIPFTGKSK